MSRGLSDDAATKQIGQMTKFIELEAKQKAEEIRIKVSMFSPDIVGARGDPGRCLGRVERALLH